MELKQNYVAPSLRWAPIQLDRSLLASLTGDGLEGWNDDAEEGTWQ